MIALLVSLSGPPSASYQPAPVWLNAGRVYTSSTTHVGIRPAFNVTPGELDVGATVQVTAKAITL